ncbi:alpha/beta fold hydrolase [Lysobacter korlensis]|uniref:Alpha/beta fold hydrolase n=1 Tax=Lysobacter korlensis TaxID=553636 RepID=A0ABV6RYC0_9GAMM
MSTRHSVAVDRGALAAETDGDPQRPALLLLHAGIATRRMWDPLIPALAERFFVIRYDTRGFGESTSQAVEFSNRADAIAVLDAVGVASATLIGASRGGTIALDTALEHPSRVRALVLIGSGPGGWDGAIDPAEEAMLDAADAAEEAGEWDRLFELELELWNIGPRRSRDDVDPAFLETARALGRSNRAAFEAQGQCIPVPLDPPAIGRLTEVAVPALVLAGEHDLSFVHDQQRLLAEHLPDVTAARIEAAAHLPSVERPDAVLEVLLSWLAEHAG